jgi:hypothetical protein
MPYKVAKYVTRSGETTVTDYGPWHSLGDAQSNALQLADIPKFGPIKVKWVSNSEDFRDNPSITQRIWYLYVDGTYTSVLVKEVEA